jgi:hypothetical protein
VRVTFATIHRSDLTMLRDARLDATLAEAELLLAAAATLAHTFKMIRTAL